MTDKQIIIDEIDVTALYSDQIACMNRYEVARLFIKTVELLVAKEQECEELKKIINEAKNSKLDLNSFFAIEATVGEYQLELDQLKAENEELKTMLKDLSYENQKFCYQIEEQTKQLEPFKDEYFKGLDNVVIAELAKKSIRITAENSKLEQTLTEIKEIAETAAKCMYATYSDDYTEGYSWLGRIILQTISECEGNDE